MSVSCSAGPNVLKYKVKTAQNTNMQFNQATRLIYARKSANTGI